MALPVFVGALLVVVVYRTVRPDGTSRRTTLAQVAVLAMSCAVVVAPWIYRNWVVFQSAQISERSGLSVYMRAVFNEVTPAEYRGLFYVWAPSPIRPAVGRVLGFTPRDLEADGALIRLVGDDGSPVAESDLEAERAGQPERTVSLVAKARAERVKVRKALRPQGLGYRTNLIADELMKQRGMEMMKDAPARTIAGAVTSLWRGGFLLIPLLAFALVHAWRRRREDLLMFCMPAMGFVALLSFFSVFEPRYSAPMTPLAFVAAAVAAAGVSRYRARGLAAARDLSVFGRADALAPGLETEAQ
jgi:4-amino-4-deoxy-L-arabinose transferase-like glycosyltransferase